MEKFPTISNQTPEDEHDEGQEIYQEKTAENHEDNSKMSRRGFLKTLLGAALATGLTKPDSAEASGNCSTTESCQRTVEAHIRAQEASLRKEYWKPSVANCNSINTQLQQAQNECKEYLTTERRDYFSEFNKPGYNGPITKAQYEAYINKCAVCRRQKEFFWNTVKPACEKLGFKY